jgi:hypothetical protein
MSKNPSFVDFKDGGKARGLLLDSTRTIYLIEIEKLEIHQIGRAHV